jgi:hypothetical protein
MLLEDLCPFLLPVFVSFCFVIFIAVPRVARDVFRTRRYSTAFLSMAAWNRGSPLLAVRCSWFLTLHCRCTCSTSAQYCISWSRGFFLRFTSLGPPCSINQWAHLLKEMINHAWTFLSIKRLYICVACHWSGWGQFPSPLLSCSLLSSSASRLYPACLTYAEPVLGSWVL